MGSEPPPALGPEATAVRRQFEELARQVSPLRHASPEAIHHTVEALMLGFALGLGTAVYQPEWSPTAYQELLAWRARRAGVSPERLRDMDRLWARSTAERSRYTDRERP